MFLVFTILNTDVSALVHFNSDCLPEDYSKLSGSIIVLTSPDAPAAILLCNENIN